MRDIEAGNRVRLASDFSGAGGTAESLYLYQGSADLSDVNLATNDYTGAGWVRFDVDNITSYIPDQLNFNVSSSNSIGIGGLIVFNDVRSDVDATIDNSGVTSADGSVSVGADQSASITASNESEAEADGGSVFTSGVSVAAAGTVATNQVFASADANVTDSTLGAADASIGGGVSVTSASDAAITATTDSALTVFGGGTSVAVGVTLAFNRVGVPSYLLSTVDDLFDGAIDDALIEPASTSAAIVGSDVYATSDVLVSSDNEAVIDSAITNAAFASSVSLGSSADTVVTVAPVLAFNRLASATSAAIDTSDVVRTDTGDVLVTASESGSIDSSIGITSASLALGLGQSVSFSFGFNFALNEIDSGVTATISDSGVTATTGDVSVVVTEAASITATGVAVSAAASAGTGSTFGFSVAGAVAVNEILGGANASIDSSAVSAGDVTITADNTADIDALIAAASAAVSFGVGADGVAGSIGLGVADNRIGFDYDDQRPDADEEGVLDALGVQAFSSDSAIDASGDVTVAATSESLIDATIVAASAALAASTSGNAVAISAAGAASNNQVATRVRAYIDGDGSGTGAGVNARSIDIDASDESAIAALSGAASISGSVAGGQCEWRYLGGLEPCPERGRRGCRGVHRQCR